MKNSLNFALATSLLLLCAALPSHAQGVFDHIKQSARDKANQTADTAIDTGVNKAIGKATPAAPATTTTTTTADASTATPAPGPAQDPAPPAQQDPPPQDAPAAPAATGVKAYQNYDFTPGDTILFADDFTATQDGEFPEQWELIKGQGVVNKQQGYQSLILTDGNYAQVSPRVKNKSYLGNQYTIEYDTFFVPGSYGVMAFFEKGDSESYVSINSAEVSYVNGDDSYTLNAQLPAGVREENYEGHWHHIALAVKGRQLKVYVDQFRIITIPDMHNTFNSVVMGGLASQELPLVFRNYRLASGGGMNMIGQKFTDTKIVTHGINFDIDKATLRPESMGTLNQIKTIMTNNPDLKFEVGGYTDNTGASAHNLTLSQQRAEAVKAQLISMGIPATRLTAKGYGDTKPIADNATPEGKANNRRVEFLKTS